MTTVTLTINGAEIIAEAGLTILEVARRSDINIPTLCHVQGKPAENPCQMCVVEIEGQKGLIHSCVGLARDGMVISTDSATISAHRLERLAILAETHFGDCKAPCNLTCPGQINVQGYIALDIDLTGTGKITGSLTITKMSLSQDGQTLQTVSGNRSGISRDNHPIPGQPHTRMNQSFLSFNLHHTHLAGVLCRFPLHMTESGNIDIRSSGNLKNGKASLSNYLCAINGKCYSSHTQIIWWSRV